jgi:hypothetical protein
MKNSNPGTQISRPDMGKRLIRFILDVFESWYHMGQFL